MKQHWTEQAMLIDRKTGECFTGLDLVKLEIRRDVVWLIRKIPLVSPLLIAWIYYVIGTYLGTY